VIVFAHDLTVYALRNNTWERTVVNGVFWDSVKAVNILKSGLAGADSAKIIIPYDAMSSDVIQIGDKLVKGVQTYEIISKPAELNERFTDMVTVTSVDFKDFGGCMKHWEVGGK
jgi:hypothetical protein